MHSEREPSLSTEKRTGKKEKNADTGLAVYFDRFASAITLWTGSATAFAVAFAVVVFWAITGPVFDYSETWQLVINTGTTIVTFLMVFVIQQSQNKDSRALHLKLDELLIAIKEADNDFVDAEDLREDELNALAERCSARSEVIAKRASELKDLSGEKRRSAGSVEPD